MTIMAHMTWQNTDAGLRVHILIPHRETPYGDDDALAMVVRCEDVMVDDGNFQSQTAEARRNCARESNWNVRR